MNLKCWVVTKQFCFRLTFRCLICCFYCLEKLLKFINKNAYIMVSGSSNSFCHFVFKLRRYFSKTTNAAAIGGCIYYVYIGTDMYSVILIPV